MSDVETIANLHARAAVRSGVPWTCLCHACCAQRLIDDIMEEPWKPQPWKEPLPIGVLLFFVALYGFVRLMG